MMKESSGKTDNQSGFTAFCDLQRLIALFQGTFCKRFTCRDPVAVELTILLLL